MGIRSNLFLQKFRRSNKRVLNLDDAEVERLQYSHDVYRTLFEGNFSSPVTELLQKGAKVLDFRCGPGTWACEMSSDFNKSTFYAVESVSCFPTEKPFNVTFIKSSTLSYHIPFEDNCFDFVYVHSAILWYTSTQWKEVIIPELIRILKPGGYLEIMEAEFELFGEGPETPIMTKNMEKFRTLLRSYKINPYMIVDLPEILESTNQVTDVQQSIRKCPVGNWDPILGEWGARISIFLMLRALGLTSKKNYDDISNKMMIEMDKVRSHFRNHRIWAKKSNLNHVFL